MARGILIREDLRRPIPKLRRLAPTLLFLAGTLLSGTLALAQAPNDSEPAPRTSANSPSRPLVTFDDGQLTINANNASLTDILYALRASTGADIDIPVNASSERVTAQLGPGAPRKVLADLLGWSSFDYIIRASDDDPLVVQSVTLLERAKGLVNPAQRPTGVVAATRPTSAPQPQPEAETPSTAVAEVATSVPDAHPDRSDPLPDKPTSSSSLQSRVTGSGSTPVGVSPGGSAGQSPSDMIQQLQQMYEQRRIMQQQENQNAGRSGH